MDVKIIFDNNATAGFKKGWGFACLIELDTAKILFDTGEDAKILDNLKKFQIDPNSIDFIILSHPHFDHIGGLKYLIPKISPNCSLYIPSFFPVELKMEIMSVCQLHETFGFEKVIENVYVDTARDYVSEQFCMIDLPQGILVITGCAHPGVDNILLKAQQYERPLYGVIGGFHSFRKLDFLKDLAFIAPCHCTSHKNAILKQYPDSAHPCNAGSTFHF
jgi:7,8-dihydropterin-6-yl-methyl-4-(beta-D-ribofuranosyl)aminobenzene 5'-phosphate synthase